MAEGRGKQPIDDPVVTGTRRLLGALVHAFTASGIVCALLAVQDVLGGRYERAFGWLLLALVIDAVDGAMARAIRITEVLPRFSGERLDLVIDYVTYVFVPVLALKLGGHLAGWTGEVLAAAVLLSSLFHFSDTASKADDNCFVGFPAVWNLVAFCLFAWALKGWAAEALVAVLVVATFVPMRWLHPFRVRRLLGLNLAMTALGIGAAMRALVVGFPADPATALALAAAAAYFTGLACLWPWLGRDGGGKA
jgi:phosphatidylcholine synthase